MNVLLILLSLELFLFFFFVFISFFFFFFILFTDKAAAIKVLEEMKVEDSECAAQQLIDTYDTNKNGIIEFWEVRIIIIVFFIKIVFFGMKLIK